VQRGTGEIGGKCLQRDSRELEGLEQKAAGRATGKLEKWWRGEKMVTGERPQPRKNEQWTLLRRSW
jgi:hypothetical protein